MTKNIFTLCFLLTSSYLFSQTSLQRVYEYDASGNRTCRKVVPLPGDGGGKSLVSGVSSTNTETDVYYADEIGDISVQVYPNPASEKVFIQITNYEDLYSGELFLYTPDGKLLKKISVTSGKIEVDLSAQPPGFYLLKLTINDFHQEWKIVKG